MPQAPSSDPQVAPAARTAPTATEMYEAARLASRELHSQRDQLRSDRRQLQQEIANSTNSVEKQGLEARLQILDARLADVEKQIASADAVVAQRAAIPGVVVQEIPRGPDIPPEALVLSGMGMVFVILLPIAIAWGVRYVKRGTAAVAALPADLAARLTNMERGIEAVAIEVERLGEGQRFVTQLLAEGEKRRQQQQLGAASGPGGRES